MGSFRIQLKDSTSIKRKPKSDVFVNLLTGFGKSVVFQAFPIVYSYVDQLV